MQNKKTLRILVVPVEGEARVKTIEYGLSELQAAIGGGYIEEFSSDESWSGYCDEEGKIKGLPVNHRATRVARNLGWSAYDVLVGDAVFTGPVDNDGDDTDVPEWVLEVANRVGSLSDKEYANA